MNAILTFTAKKTFTAKQVINDFLTYVRKPLYIAEDTSMSKSEKFRYLSKVLLCKLALIFVLAPIIYFTKKFTGAKSTAWDDTWSMYAFVVIIAPIVEETIFRGALHYSRWSIALFASFFMGIFAKYIGINERINIPLGFVYFACAVLFPIFYFVSKPLDGFFKTFWTKYFSYIFHLVAIGFGLIHLSNYTGISNYLFAVPLVTSQIISGYVLGFVRMKFGLSYSIAFHAAWNFIAGFALLVELIAKFF